MSAQAIETRIRRRAAFRGPAAELWTRVAGRLRLGLYAEQKRYGLGRDLAVPLEPPNAKIPITVRPLEDADLPALFAHEVADDDIAERLEVAWRHAFIEKGARGGFVAIDSGNGTPCYVQWLLGSRDNGFIAKLGGFPALAAHEALLENAYTPPAFRGLGIMAAAMALIAARAADFGASHVLTFVAAGNIASLRGCQRAGFHPEIVHHRTNFCFGTIRRDRFEALPAGDPLRTAHF